MKIVTTLILIVITQSGICQNFEVYVSDAGNFNNPPWQIIKYDSAGQNPVTFINTNLNWPQDILFMEDSNTVLISNFGTNKITKHNATTGNYISDFATGISAPTRTVIGPDSLLYVLQWSGNGKVKRYELNGTFVDDFTSTGVPQSIGIDWDVSGNLYISSYNGKYVRRFDPQGNDMGIFISTNLLGPTNIWFDLNGDLLVADYNGTSVKRFDPSGNFLGDFIQGLNNCEGVTYLPNGNILIGNGGTSSVKMFDGSGNYLQDFISPGLGNLTTPNAVVIREINITSFEHIKENTVNVVYPTMGIKFYIDNVYLSKIKAVELFNQSGKLIAIYDIISNPIFNASNITDGTYIINIKFDDGTISTEKIIIKK